jgi:MFS family permease
MTGPQASSVPRSAAAVRLLVPALGMTAGIQTLDPMIATVALVKAAKALGFSSATLALASGISTLALAASVIPTGLLADRLGRRRVLLAALVVAAAGDLVVALSPDQWVYLAGRAVAGVGLGAVFGASFAFVAMVGKEKLGSALGVFTAMSGLTTLCGAFAGGALANSSWQAAFCVVPVVCAMSFAVMLLLAPAAPGQRGRRPDYLGMTLLAIAAVGILLGISNAAASLSAPRTWVPVLAGLVALALFVPREGRLAHPAFPVGLFRSRVFVAALIAGLAWNGAQACVVLQLSNLWQYVEHYSTLAVTLGQLPLSIVAIASAAAAGQMLGRGLAPRRLLTAAILIMVIGFAALRLTGYGSPYAAFVPALILIAAGLSATSVPQAQLYMAQAPPDHFGAVTSSRLASGQFGYAIGLAGSSVLVSSLTITAVTSRLLHAGVPPGRVGQGLDAISWFVNTGREPGTAAGRLALHSAAGSYLSAFHVTMLLAALVLAVAGAACWLLLRPGALTGLPVPPGTEAPPVQAQAGNPGAVREAG